MIENDQELQRAQEWIDYWQSTRHVGQSWIGNEQASQKIMDLRRQIKDYRRRQAGQAPIESPAGAEAPDALP